MGPREGETGGGSGRHGPYDPETGKGSGRTHGSSLVLYRGDGPQPKEGETGKGSKMACDRRTPTPPTTLARTPLTSNDSNNNDGRLLPSTAAAYIKDCFYHGDKIGIEAQASEEYCGNIHYRPYRLLVRRGFGMSSFAWTFLWVDFVDEE
ncbi:uncharacterized protein LTR77_008676 [Saxophila tyrrhenica]|uniref:Uncharacterized protein n=1 Tax=Saxophila tyrrhenica TaxID=1690608 RepID=A0AAV9P392_9PEZI|nr:hypothetical protein LTR77_008676 [Saxophila tyrrhenica]